jgi:hypothetical protein
MRHGTKLILMLLVLMVGFEAEAGLEGDEIVVSERFPTAGDVRNPQTTVVEVGSGDAVTTPGQNATTIDVDPDAITLTLGCDFTVCNRITTSATFNGLALSDLDWSAPPGPPLAIEVESTGYFDPARVELRSGEILIDLIFTAWRDGDTVRIVPIYSPPVVIDVAPVGLSDRVSEAGRISVSILGSADVAVSEIDLASLRFGPGEAGLAVPDRSTQTLHAKLGDVNRDDEPDLAVSFSAADAALARDATEACLRGRLGARPFLACDRLEGAPGR